MANGECVYSQASARCMQALQARVTGRLASSPDEQGVHYRPRLFKVVVVDGDEELY
jgi:hypothetical protein